MRKFFLGIGICFGVFASLPLAEALDYSTYGPEYWQNWIRRVMPKTRQLRSSRTNSVKNWGPAYYRNRNTAATTVIPTMLSRIGRVQRSVSKKTSPASTVENTKSLTIKINPVRAGHAVSSLDSTPVNVFELGVFNTSKIQRNYFPEALLLDKITFQMFQNTGLASDPTHFDIQIWYDTRGLSLSQEQTFDEESQQFQFESDGKVSVQFHNARVAQSEDLKIGVKIVPHDVSLLPHIPGVFKLRVLAASARGESSRQAVETVLSGSLLSDQIAFDPTPTTTGDSVFTSRSVEQIYGKALSAGERAAVLGINLEAHYDDMLVEEITVSDDLSGESVDDFVTRVFAIDTTSGRTLNETSFVHGRAHFRFFDPIQINRETERSLRFEVQLASTVDHSSQNTIFRLNVLPSDMVVRGIGSGRDVADADKNFSVDSETFIVLNAGGDLTVAPSAVQPDGFSALGSLERVYQVSIRNPGSRDISLGRISFSVRLAGLDFTGGRSADDFELRQMISNRETNALEFTPSLGAGDIVIFDTSGGELFLPRRASLDFTLKMRLDNIAGGQDDNDSVVVSILRDSNFASGAVDSLRTGGRYFIWSDHSGRPHTYGSSDWLSGYLLWGVDTNSKINYRR